MMALGIVTPLMSATSFINSMKSMQFAVKDTRELLTLPQLPQAEREVPLEDHTIRFQNVSFSYGGAAGTEVLHHLDLTIPQGSSLPWWAPPAAESLPSPGWPPGSGM